MNEKYILTFIDSKLIYLKYDIRNEIVHIGGFLKYKLLIENIIIDYFNIKNVPPCKYTQVNKIKFNFKMSVEEFKKVLCEFDNNNLVYEQVTTLRGGW